MMKAGNNIKSAIPYADEWFKSATIGHSTVDIRDWRPANRGQSPIRALIHADHRMSICELRRANLEPTTVRAEKDVDTRDQSVDHGDSCSDNAARRSDNRLSYADNQGGFVTELELSPVFPLCTAYTVDNG